MEPTAEQRQPCCICEVNEHDTLCLNCGRVHCYACRHTTDDDINVCSDCYVALQRPAADDAGEGGAEL